MALPLLAVPIIGGAAAARGIHSAFRGHRISREVSELRETINDRDRDTAKKVETDRTNAVAALEDLAQVQEEVSNTEMPRFVDLFGRLKNVELSDVPEVPELEAIPIDTLAEMKLVSNAVGAVGAGVAGSATGALAATGSYVAVGQLAAASTGTAIAGLSGAAAKSATYAWLGGGSLASGGAGVAGGAVVMGGIVTAPLALFGGEAYKKIQEKSAMKAEQALAEAEEVFASRLALCELMRSVTKCAHQSTATIVRLQEPLDFSLDDLEKLLMTNGDNYADYDGEAKSVVHIAVNYARAANGLVKTPILGEDGELKEDYLRAVSATTDLLEHASGVS